MADGRHSKAPETPEPRKARQPLSAARFKATPEFANFTDIMKQLLKVPKAELDERVRAAKAASPRMGNPKSPGQKPSKTFLSEDGK
jgi:hypothetical protein